MTACAIGGDSTLKDTQAAAKSLKVPITFLAHEGRTEIRRLGLNHDEAVPILFQGQFDAESDYPPPCPAGRAAQDCVASSV